MLISVAMSISVAISIPVVALVLVGMLSCKIRLIRVGPPGSCPVPTSVAILILSGVFTLSVTPSLSMVVPRGAIFPGDLDKGRVAGTVRDPVVTLVRRQERGSAPQQGLSPLSIPVRSPLGTRGRIRVCMAVREVFPALTVFPAVA